MFESTLLINDWGLVEAPETFLADGSVGEQTEDAQAVKGFRAGLCCGVADRMALEVVLLLTLGRLGAGNCFRDLPSDEVILLSARSRFGWRRGIGSSSDSDSLESSNISSSSVID